MSYKCPISKKQYNKGAKTYLKEWYSLINPLLKLPSVDKVRGFDPDILLIMKSGKSCGISVELALDICKLIRCNTK